MLLYRLTLLHKIANLRSDDGQTMHIKIARGKRRGGEAKSYLEQNSGKFCRGMLDGSYEVSDAFSPTNMVEKKLRDFALQFRSRGSYRFRCATARIVCAHVSGHGAWSPSFCLSDDVVRFQITLMEWVGVSHLLKKVNMCVLGPCLLFYVVLLCFLVFAYGFMLLFFVVCLRF